MGGSAGVKACLVAQPDSTQTLAPRLMAHVRDLSMLGVVKVVMVYAEAEFSSLWSL